MFYFLVILGLSCIILGIFLNNSKSKNQGQNQDPSYQETEELYLLHERVRQVEKLLAGETPYLDEIEEGSSKEDKDREVGAKGKEDRIKEDIDRQSIGSGNYGLDKYKLLLRYEEENYSLEEISSKLNMNKGEVLLLKNLYKDYQE